MKIRTSDDFKRFRAQRRVCDQFWFRWVPGLVLLAFVIICTLGLGE